MKPFAADLYPAIAGLGVSCASTPPLTRSAPTPGGNFLNAMDELIPNVDVPEGIRGNWRVERFTVSDTDIEIENLRCMFKAGMGGRIMRPGTYTRLMCGREIVMSDTSAEKRDHVEAVRRAKGAVLLNGLGLGMVLNACLLKPEVQRAIVVEKSSDVLALVAPHYDAKFENKVQFVLADALEYTPPRGLRFGMVWHDIWAFICSDNLESMKRLHRRYSKRTEWQGSWCRSLCEIHA